MTLRSDDFLKITVEQARAGHPADRQVPRWLVDSGQPARPAVNSRVAFTLLGEPASKANSRRIVSFCARSAVVKSKKALGYERDALLQIPPVARQRLEGPVRVTLRSGR